MRELRNECYILLFLYVKHYLKQIFFLIAKIVTVSETILKLVETHTYKTTLTPTFYE